MILLKQHMRIKKKHNKRNIKLHTSFLYIKLNSSVSLVSAGFLSQPLFVCEKTQTRDQEQETHLSSWSHVDAFNIGCLDNYTWVTAQTSNQGLHLANLDQSHRRLSASPLWLAGRRHIPPITHPPHDSPSGTFLRHLLAVTAQRACAPLTNSGSANEAHCLGGWNNVSPPFWAAAGWRNHILLSVQVHVIDSELAQWEVATWIFNECGDFAVQSQCRNRAGLVVTKASLEWSIKGITWCPSGCLCLLKEQIFEQGVLRHTADFPSRFFSFF